MKTFGDLYDKLMAIHEAANELQEATRCFNSYGGTTTQAERVSQAHNWLRDLRDEPIEVDE